MMKKVEKYLANLILDVAINTENRTSYWGIYQPHEPKELIIAAKKDKGKRIISK